MNYVLEGEYNSFMIDQIVEQFSIDRFIQECVILGENTTSTVKLKALNEAEANSTDKNKSIMKTLVDFIKRIFDKFMVNVNKFIADDGKYLEKYKDVILNREINFAKSVTMQDYEQGINNMKNTKIDPLTTQTVKSYITLTSDEIAGKMESDMLVKTNIKREADERFSAYCVTVFTGGKENKEIPVGSLNMTNMYNYCANYKAMADQISADQSTLESVANNFDSITKSVLASNATTESAYSLVYNTILQEEDKPAGVTINTNNDNNASNNTNDNEENLAKKLAPSTNVGNKDKETDDQVKAGMQGQNSEMNDKINACIKAYKDVVTAIFTAKLTAAEKIRADYMKIIKAHVKSHVGNVDSKETDAQNATQTASYAQYNTAISNMAADSAKELNTRLVAYNTAQGDAKNTALANIKTFLKNTTKLDFPNEVINNMAGKAQG